MKKIVVLAAALAISLCMLGCAQGEDKNVGDSKEADDAITSQDTTEAKIGEVIPITTDYGNLEVAVEAFEDNAKATSFMLEYGNVKETQHVALLNLAVKNISYKSTDSSLPDYVKLASSIRVTGADGVSLSEMNGAIDVDGYQAAAGAMFECKQGESKRIAVFYPIEMGLENITVRIGDYTVFAPVASA